MKTEEIFARTVLEPANNGTENCLPVGTRLADFEITGILGEGGFGIVYLAFDHSLQRTVAIKEYMPGTLSGRAADGSVMVRAERHKATFDAGLKSFINEARLLAQFDHPSLVKVYRFWEQNKTAYMAMRYYDGKTLKDIVNRRPELVTEAWLKFIFKQILEALDALYKAKILHRDVSPDNIIVQKNGDAVLLDFGSARQIIGDMTQGLTVILKPGYAPIEQYADDSSMPQGPWTDIYALAAVMYFAIMKTAPQTSVARVGKDLLPPLMPDEHPGFSEKFLQAINKGLAIQPEERPQTMDEFRRMLGISAFVSARNSRSASASSKGQPSSVQSGDGKRHPTTRPGKTRAKADLDELPPAKNRVHPGLIVLALLVLLGVGIVAYLPTLQKGTESPPPAEAASSRPAPVSAPTALPASSANPQADAELKDWDAIKTDGDIEKITAFLQKYPQGKFTDAANLRLQELNKAAGSGTATAASATGASMAASAPSASAGTGTPAKEDAAGKEEPAPAATYPVKLAIKPWGRVNVNGKFRALSPPDKEILLTEGKHRVKISNPDFPNADHVVKIDVSKKKTVTIEHDFTQK